MSSQHTVAYLPNGMVSMEYTPLHLLPLTRKNSRSPLLTLPAELRALIFEYVLGNLYINTKSGRAYGKGRWVQDTRTAFALLRTCRQIYAETISMVCLLNTFVLSDSFFRFAQKRLARGQLNLVREVLYGDFILILDCYGNRPNPVSGKFRVVRPIKLNRAQSEMYLLKEAQRQGMSVLEFVQMQEGKDVEIVFV